MEEIELQKEYAKLESDEELHRLSFLLQRKCRCRDTSHCNRYQQEKNKIFGERVKQLLAQGIMINAMADMQALQRNKTDEKLKKETEV